MQIVAISFGSESRGDPVDEVYFYSADDPYIAEEGKNIFESDPSHKFKVCILYNTVAKKTLSLRPCYNMLLPPCDTIRSHYMCGGCT